MTKNNFILTGYVSGAIDPWFITGFTDAEGLNKIRKIKAGMNKGRCVPQQIRSYSTQRMRENNDSINLSVKNYGITKGKYN